MVPLPKVKVEWGDAADSPQEVAKSMQILILLTILSLAPSILIVMTSFTRIIIVLSFLRHALGTQTIPPNQVLISFALLLTFLTMLPTYNKINQNAMKPYFEGKMPQKVAIAEAEKPIREFMSKHTRQKDLELFLYASGTPRPKTFADIPTIVLIPSFLLSELKTAFSMGFMLFVSFLVIDMVIASILMSIGMFMLPPMMISLPIKVMLFVLVDGWYLVIKSLIFSFR
jgi:flagellar biosynthetic protein FliP